MEHYSRYRVAAAHIFIGTLLESIPVGAQPIDPYRLASAEALHDAAVAALEESNYAEACSKLETVLQMIPNGLGAKETLAECYERAGRLARALKTYAELSIEAAARGQPDRSLRVRQKANELRLRVAELTIKVPDALRAARPEVRLGPDVVEPAAWGTPIPIDAGIHLLMVSVAGKVRRQNTIEVRDGERIVVAIPGGTLNHEDMPAQDIPPRVGKTGPPPMTEAPRTPAPGSAAGPRRDGEEAAGGSLQRDAGIFVGIIGLASVGVGTFLATQASTNGAMSNDDDRLWLAASLLLGTGGTAVIAGAILGATAPSSTEPAWSGGAPVKRTGWQLLPVIKASGVTGTLRATF